MQSKKTTQQRHIEKILKANEEARKMVDQVRTDREGELLPERPENDETVRPSMRRRRV